MMSASIESESKMPPPHQAGFSLLEVLISIVILSILFSVLGQTLININRTQSHLDRYFQTQRDLFYTQQSLRTILRGVTSKRPFGERQDGYVFVGSATEATGQLVNTFMGGQHLHPFTLRASRDGASHTLEVELPDKTYQFTPFLAEGVRLAYLDRNMTEHAEWPPEETTMPTIADDVGYKPEDLLPEAILIRSSNPAIPTTMVFRIDY